MSRGSCGAFGSLISPASASPACSGPPCLSAVGKPDDPGSLSESLLIEWGIRSWITRRTAMQLSPYRAGLAGRHLQRLPVAPAFLACSFPLRLSPSGQPDDPGASLRAPPDCVRDSTPRPAAHTFTAHGSPVVDVLSDDGRGHLGVPHVAYLHAPTIRPPAPLRHVAGSPDRGLLWGLR